MDRHQSIATIVFMSMRCAFYMHKAAAALQLIHILQVQDYTQAEMALLFMISSPGGLFLAGDTAQSVEHGVTFRFTEVLAAIVCELGI